MACAGERRVHDVGGLVDAVHGSSGGTPCCWISLASGPYRLSRQLNVSRTVTIAAEEAGGAVLEGSGSERVLSVVLSGRVELVGLVVMR